jgi:hypothetical protein
MRSPSGGSRIVPPSLVPMLQRGNAGPDALRPPRPGIAVFLLHRTARLRKNTRACRARIPSPFRTFGTRSVPGSVPTQSMGTSFFFGRSRRASRERAARTRVRGLAYTRRQGAPCGHRQGALTHTPIHPYNPPSGARPPARVNGLPAVAVRGRSPIHPSTHTIPRQGLARRLASMGSLRSPSGSTHPNTHTSPPSAHRKIGFMKRMRLSWPASSTD